jgi:uncharacterized protein YbcI
VAENWGGRAEPATQPADLTGSGLYERRNPCAAGRGRRVGDDPRRLKWGVTVPDLTTQRRDRERRIDAEISREIVRIHAHYYGRGPTRAKTYVNEEIVLCVLGEIYTPSESMLIEAGRFEEVRTNRMAFQDSVEPIMREGVERICDREVESFFSQISPDDRACEVFVLAGEEHDA